VPDNGFRHLYKCAQNLKHVINVNKCMQIFYHALRARDCHSIQTLNVGSLASISELYITALAGFKSTNRYFTNMLSGWLTSPMISFEACSSHVCSTFNLIAEAVVQRVDTGMTNPGSGRVPNPCQVHLILT
jgi:hypothetical protein